VAFTPYRQQYEQLITSPRMHYMETYNASEGFFGIQDDPNDKSMLLMLDYDCFYEFIPLESLECRVESLEFASDVPSAERPQVSDDTSGTGMAVENSTLSTLNSTLCR